MSMPTNPFEILGLPVRRDLTDAQVDAAWRKIAVATHPDRPDGGDLARYTQASAAFAELRVPWSRSEAYADVVEQARTQGYDGLDDGGQLYTEPLPQFRGKGETLADRAERQIEYTDEDPWIRKTFERELEKRGRKSLMPEDAYRDRDYRWAYGDEGD